MGSAFDLGPRARRVFAGAYVLSLALAIGYGQIAPDHVFGFQMFNESSNIEIALYREVERSGTTELLPLPDGEWDAPDEHGVMHHFSWRERVRASPLHRLGESVHASYGLAAQLFRLELALEDVARNVPRDHETRALVAVVETVKNGRPSGSVRFRVERP